ncbi:MAG: hypothetical protein E7513_07010 [Ruminococcaceae bacterium]|nr:hypothetical protein [Oscillospiraceae bacterium]
MVEYKLFKQDKYYNNCGYYSTYGIIVFKDKKHIRTVCDISTNKEKVQKLVDKFNAYKLDPTHLSMAIEDFLYDLKA